ncbi:MAG: glycosyltransferase [Crocinitomix sp.]|nr:glycosyltransferase [Crocinitomix sp.]
MAEKVLILIAIPDFDYKNQNSAVLAYLTEVKEAFVKNGDEADFGYFENVPVNKDGAPIIVYSGLKGLIKRLVKQWKWLYQSLALKIYFSKQKSLLKQLLSGKKYDKIIEFHTVGSTVGVELKRKWGANLSVIFDSPVAEQFLEMYGTRTIFWPKIKASERITMQNADAVLAYSSTCANYLVQRYRIPIPITILPCVIHKKEIIERAPSAIFSIGFIGSFLCWHKLELLVNVFAEFIKEYPDSKLYLVGYGVEWKAIKNLVNELELEDYVDLPGFVSEEELQEYKRMFTIAIMPGSNWYGSPLKLFEYAFAQIPFIAPSTPTVRSIFKEEVDCLFIDEQNEAGSLMEKLTYAYNHPQAMNQLGINAYNSVLTRFDDEAYNQQIINGLSLEKKF